MIGRIRIAQVAVLGFCLAGSATARSNRTQVAARPAISRAKVLATGHQARREVMRMLDRARVMRDVVGATCYDGKLSEINATLRPIETGDPSRNPPRLLQITAERVRRLLAEAKHCTSRYPTSVAEGFLGGPAFAVDVEIDPRIPAEDPSRFPDRRPTDR